MSDFFSLNDCKAGVVCKVVYLDNTIDEKIYVRLCELGFVRGNKVKYVAKSIFKKSCLVEVCGCQITLRNDVAKNIYVE